MHAVKRIEIIANSFELGKILETLAEAKISNHLVIRNVAGHVKTEDLDMTMLDDNVYVIAFCPPEEIKSTVETLRPILNKFGGTCYISDAIEIRSVRCVASL